MKIAILFLILAASSATAKDQGNHPTYGAGLGSCGTWIRDRKSELGWQVDFSWIQGNIAGIALAHPDESQKDTDPNGMISWLDTYCSAHPLTSMYIAAIDLYYSTVE
jgi:hypothetical protein